MASANRSDGVRTVERILVGFSETEVSPRSPVVVGFKCESSI
jgi:hypothetical protein